MGLWFVLRCLSMLEVTMGQQSPLHFLRLLMSKCSRNNANTRKWTFVLQANVSRAKVDPSEKVFPPTSCTSKSTTNRTSSVKSVQSGVLGASLVFHGSNMQREDAERMAFIYQVRPSARAHMFHAVYQNHSKVDGFFSGQATAKETVSVGTQTPSPPFNCRMPPHFMINQFERNYNRLISSLNSRSQFDHRKKATGSHLQQGRREPWQFENSFRSQQSSTPVFAMASQSAQVH